MTWREKCRWCDAGEADADALTPMPKRWPWPTKDLSGEKVDLRGGMRGYLRGMGAYL